jgi:hypothetical protein
MIRSLDVIDRLPFELASRLESDPFFLDIPIVIYEEGNIATEMAKKQALITTKSGHRGAAVIIPQLVLSDPYHDLQFGPCLLRPAFQAIEIPELNRDPNGTGKSARRIGRRIHSNIKIFGIQGLVKTFIPDEPFMVPLRLSDDVAKTTRGYELNYHCLEDDGEQLSMCQRVTFFPLGETQIELLSTTVDAEIYYTLDDSYPSKANPNAHLYNGPIDIPDAPDIICRACAYPLGTTNAGNGGEPIDPALLSTLPSWVARKTIT